MTAWPREGGIHLRPGAVALHDAEWVAWPGTGLEGRDLGLAEVSGAVLAGQHVRASGVPGGEGDWHCYDLDFEFVYVLVGSLELETRDGERHLLVAGSSFAHTAFLWHRDLQRSADLEVVRLTVPTAEQRFDGLDAALPARSTSGAPAAVYSSVAEGSAPAAPEVEPDSVTWAERDLGTAGLTEGRIRLQVLEIRDTSVHRLPASQWLYVLGGTAEPSDDTAVALLTAGDSLSTDARSHADRTGRYEFSPDFAVLTLSTGNGRL
ncbi:hypothetical protein [uncultured Amnibacterium sp.]|uniref:hypothetical protein n=1 Tax=uncultured Amnibacterium sp. TaxID=1631851 RepID=UPI0035CB0AD8